MTAANRAIVTRYAARLVALVLGWAVGILATTGVQFIDLVRERSLVALAILVFGWALHVAQSYADTGRWEDVPPVAMLRAHRSQPSAPPQAQPPSPPPPVPAPVVPRYPFPQTGSGGVAVNPAEAPSMTGQSG